MHARQAVLTVVGALACFASVGGLEKPGVTYKVFQFPADKIPRIDGNTDDWSMVPERYVVGTDQLQDDSRKHPRPDPKTLDVRVRVGWVKGLNRLYFLYEAYDDYWDFSLPGLHNDTFEIVVDGDASGGPLIDKGHKEFWTPDRVGEAAAAPDSRISDDEAHWAIHGVHAQNYHIFTPAVNKDWALAWGAPSWVKELPWANAATSFHGKPGEPGKLVLEFWITPFDYAGPEGPQRAVESVLAENKIIGLSWAVIDYDDVKAPRKQRILEPVAQAHDVRQRLGIVCVPAHAAGAAVPEDHRGAMDLQGGRHGPPAGRVQGSVGRQDHVVEMGLRRRRDLDRAASAPRLREARQLCRRARHRRARRIVTSVEGVGRAVEIGDPESP